MKCGGKGILSPWSLFTLSPSPSFPLFRSSLSFTLFLCIFPSFPSSLPPSFPPSLSSFLSLFPSLSPFLSFPSLPPSFPPSEQARKHRPCVVFIDELDAVGGARVASSVHPYSRMTLNQLLVEMDGYKELEGVVIIGATNFPESLDK